MTPEESRLVTELFDRLAALESAPRDQGAERGIAENLARAPHAVYPLVQTVLVQDEALKAANARIEELEAALGEPGAAPRPGGFLDNVRESLFGRAEPRAGSVPSVRPGGSPWAGAPGYRAEAATAPAPMAAPASGSGGSFLGTAAAAAAGMIGGSLLLGGIRSMLGGHQHGPFAGAFDQLSAGQPADQSTPWRGGSDDLAHQAGIDDIGRHPASSGSADDERAGVLDGAQDNTGDDDADFDEGPDDDTDFA